MDLVNKSFFSHENFFHLFLIEQKVDQKKEELRNVKLSRDNSFNLSHCDTFFSGSMTFFKWAFFVPPLVTVYRSYPKAKIPFFNYLYCASH